MPFSKKELSVILKNTALVVLGTLILAFSVAVFIIPFDLVVGGVTGLGIILERIIPIEELTASTVISILTWLVFFVGYIVLGRAFSMKTLISTLVYPPALALFGKLVSEDCLNGFFALNVNSELNLTVASVFGGVLIGLGCAVTFLGGGSTGGTDTLAFILTKILRGLKSSTAIGIIDAAVVILGVFLLGDLVLTLLGVITVFISVAVIDKVFIGSTKAFVAEIITDKYEIINRAIIEEIGRTTTIIDVIGGYSGGARKLLKVSFSVRQYTEILNIINNYDKSAFITIHRAYAIDGEGWTR